MLTTMKAVFDTFGAPIFVPVMLYIIALILKVSPKKAFTSALLAGVGLVGFTMITSSFTPVISPVVQKLVKDIGINLPALDIGWQAVAVVTYSTEIGMIFIGVSLIFQTLLFLSKWTDIFMPSDLWNNYSFMVWGSMIYLLTKNMWLAAGCMLIGNLYILLFAEVLEKRWSTYYNYPNCTITAPHHLGNVPYAIALNWILSKLGADKINLSQETLENKIGFWGEPTTVGFIVGAILGFIGNFKHLNELASWGQIATVAVTTSAVMAIFPKVAGIFASAFAAITEASKKSLKSGNKTRQWYLSVNDALGYGEPSTLITGILMIPLALVLAFILPGNLVLPVMVLTSLPYKSEVNICLTNGNIFKSLIMNAVIFSGELYMASFNAAVFTSVAKSVGVTVPSNTVMVIGFILSNITLGLIYMAFLTQNPIIICAVIVLYFVLYFVIKKNKVQVHEYLERTAEQALQPEVSV